MNILQLKKALYDRISAYWGGADVVWGATDKVKPLDPLVVLQMGTVTRATYPITQVINGILFSAYPSESTLQIDLYTAGRVIDPERPQHRENTAVNDLIDFLNFLDSPATIAWSNQHDISLLLMGGVQDLSVVINSTQWQYRAMAELRLNFTQWAAEYNGVFREEAIIFGANGLPIGIDREKWTQTVSGGGTKPLAEDTSGFFEEIQAPIKEEIINGKLKQDC